MGEVGARLKRLKTGKATGKAEVIGEIIKNWGGPVIDWVWKLCRMAFENGVVRRRFDDCHDCSIP